MRFNYKLAWFIVPAVIAALFGSWLFQQYQKALPIVVHKPIVTSTGTDLRLNNLSTTPRRPFAVSLEIMEPLDDSTPGGMGAVEQPDPITFSQSEYDKQHRRYVKYVNNIVIPASGTTVFTATIVAPKRGWVYGRLVFYCGDPRFPEQVPFLPTWVPVLLPTDKPD